MYIIKIMNCINDKDNYKNKKNNTKIRIGIKIIIIIIVKIIVIRRRIVIVILIKIHNNNKKNNSSSNNNYSRIIYILFMTRHIVGFSVLCPVRRLRQTHQCLVVVVCARRPPEINS